VGSFSSCQMGGRPYGELMDTEIGAVVFHLDKTFHPFDAMHDSSRRRIILKSYRNPNLFNVVEGHEMLIG
jgi:hypothetical protein